MKQIISDIVPCENEIHQFFLNQKIGKLLKKSNVTKKKDRSRIRVPPDIHPGFYRQEPLFCTLDVSDGTCGMAKDSHIPNKADDVSQIPVHDDHFYGDPQYSWDDYIEA